MPAAAHSLRFPKESCRSAPIRARQGTTPRGRRGQLGLSEANNEKPSNVFSFRYLGESLCSAISNAREVTFPTSARLYGRKALVQRHARLALYNLARCVLTPLHGKKRDFV